MRDRKPLLAVAAALAVVVAVSAVIFVYGVIPIPDFPSLAEQPQPIPGTVAFVRWEGRDGPCIYTIPAGGGQEERVLCGRFEGGPLAWTPEGNLALLGFQEFGGSLVLIVDPTTGWELDRFSLGREEATDVEQRFFRLSERRQEREDGTQLVFGGFESDEEAELALRHPNGSTEELLRLQDVPRDYAFWDAQWSPDGEWVLLVDSEERLVVLDAANPEPRLLASRAAEPAWFIPGERTYTIDLQDLRRR